MTLAAFLPISSAEHIRAASHDEELILARSWTELDSLIAARALDGVVLDPSADGSLNLSAVLDLIRRYRCTPVVAYVPLTERSLKVIFTLSRHGLSKAVVHPIKEHEFRKTVDALLAARLARDFLSFIEASLGRLPPNMFRTVQDLFERPHRYESAADIALQAQMGVRQVYRDFQAAQLESPKKLVTSAKLLRGYSYLRHGSLTIRMVSRKLGYSYPRIFADHTGCVFGCSPSQLRFHSNGDEVIRQLLEWFYKPHSNMRYTAMSKSTS